MRKILRDYCSKENR
jgi:hypothetical protein